MDTSRIDNWKIEQGADWTRTLPVYTGPGSTTLADLTGATAVMAEIRPTASSATLLEELTLTSGASLDIPTSTVTLTIPFTRSSPYTWTTAVYQLTVTLASGATVEVARGTVTVVPGVNH